MLFWWWAGVGKFQRGCIGCQVDRGGQSARSRHGCVFRLQQSLHRAIQCLGPTILSTLGSRHCQCDLAWSPPGHHHPAPTRQTPNSPAREGSILQKVPKFANEPNFPSRFWFKIGRFSSGPQFASFLAQYCFWGTLVMR